MNDQKPDLPAPSATHSLRWSGSRTALFAGFGALLILMAIICVDSLHTLGAFESDNAQIRLDFLNRERTLGQVRASLYETGNIVRDYILMGSDSQAQERLRTELQSVESETMAALNACIQSLPSGKKEPFQRLSIELEHYWSTIAPISKLTAAAKQELDKSALRRDMVSQHVETLAIAKELSAVNDYELKETERRIAEVFAQFRRRLLVVATVAFGFGSILAGATIVYAGRLEEKVEDKYQESLRSQRELKELSKRLVEAEERERRAISRELHDEVGQSLTALLVDVENLTELSGRESVFGQGLQKIKTLAENCVNEVRNMALLLRPSMLDDLGLVAALDWQGREVSKRTGIMVDTVEENVSDNLPEEHKICVYRIVQEALNNCSKHAYAKHIRVVVRQGPNFLQVSIEDDGKGFDAARVRGLGLVGMKERVSQLGGVLSVDSDPARGTRLRIDLPLPSPSPGQET